MGNGFGHKKKTQAMVKKTEYFKEYMDTWNIEGGLITKQTASLLLGLSHDAIRDRIKKNKLKSFKIQNDKTEYVSIREILKYRKERLEKQKNE